MRASCTHTETKDSKQNWRDFPVNIAMSGRTLAIGDIHGCCCALETLLSHVAPDADDTVIVLGDVIDRGPDSRGVIDALLDLANRTRIIFVMGNHEEMYRDALASPRRLAMWLHYGGEETLQSYGGDVANIPPEHHQFLTGGHSWWEDEENIFIHANLEPGVPLQDQSGRWLRWEHLSGHEYPHESGRRVICGHTSIPSGVPLVRNNWVCIDTHVYGGQYLTCLDVATGDLYQSSDSGDLREGVNLADLV